MPPKLTTPYRDSRTGRIIEGATFEGAVAAVSAAAEPVLGADGGVIGRVTEQALKNYLAEAGTRAAADTARRASLVDADAARRASIAAERTARRASVVTEAPAEQEAPKTSSWRRFLCCAGDDNQTDKGQAR